MADVELRGYRIGHSYYRLYEGTQEIPKGFE